MVVLASPLTPPSVGGCVRLTVGASYLRSGHTVLIIKLHACPRSILVPRPSSQSLDPLTKPSPGQPPRTSKGQSHPAPVIRPLCYRNQTSPPQRGSGSKRVRRTSGSTSLPHHCGEHSAHQRIHNLVVNGTHPLGPPLQPLK